MKITNFALIFMMIVFPFFFYSNWKASDTAKVNKWNRNYDTALTVATHDAVDQLRTNVMTTKEAGYDSRKFNRVNPEPAFQTFLHTLSLNFGAEHDMTKDVLARYVPVFAIVDYDGALFNIYQEITNNSGEKELKRVWLPKIPFSYHDQEGNIIAFTLDDYVYVFVKSENEWIQGNRKELIKEVSVPLLQNEEMFHQVRKNTIVNTLQDELAYYINEHNVYKKHLGITYTFALPLIEQEVWYNTVDDISIFAFLQGYPFERANGTYNQFALAGSRLHKTDVIQAATVNGQKIFFNKSCGFPYEVEELYSTKKAAAKAGYTEKSCLNIR